MSKLENIAGDMKLKGRLSGQPQKRRLSRGLWLIWDPSQRTLSLTRRGVAASEKERDICAAAFGLSNYHETEHQEGLWFIRRLKAHPLPAPQAALFAMETISHY